jgi:hypothetical protein
MRDLEKRVHKVETAINIDRRLSIHVINPGETIEQAELRLGLPKASAGERRIFVDTGISR